MLITFEVTAIMIDGIIVTRTFQRDEKNNIHIKQIFTVANYPSPK